MPGLYSMDRLCRRWPTPMRPSSASIKRLTSLWMKKFEATTEANRFSWSGSLLFQGRCERTVPLPPSRELNFVPAVRWAVEETKNYDKRMSKNCLLPRGLNLLKLLPLPPPSSHPPALTRLFILALFHIALTLVSYYRKRLLALNHSPNILPCPFSVEGNRAR